ncbi:MAG: nitroreductase family deazaflavin-dependent oxidoreductase [Chloroflexota bacterium]|nr:MAG: nitroreductase family deazaflavin-dependent oxidoreductase [Chloroflexota bacterium]
MSSTPFIFRLLNPVMKSVLKSPLHSLVSGQIMIITFNGRKSSKSYSTPVSYCQENETVYCFTHAGWWKNLVGSAKVRLLIRGQEHIGTAIPIREDREKKIVGLGKLLTAVPNDARFYNVAIDQQGNLDQNDLRRAVDNATMIEIRLDGSL